MPGTAVPWACSVCSSSRPCCCRSWGWHWPSPSSCPRWCSPAWPPVTSAAPVGSGSRRPRWSRPLSGGRWRPCWGAPLTATVPALTALGVLPALWVAHVRTRAWRWWGVWGRSALACVALFALTLGGGLLATEAGLVPQYEPPKLTTTELTGVWHGTDGAELRLRPGGRAEAGRLPAEPADEDWRRRDYVTCEGSGTWEPDADADNAGRDGVLVRLDGDCGEDTHWSISGSEDAPELFVLFGDPDGGELRILKRTSG
ncbi:hypothetical protein [Streptomyces sp. NPDC051636]|uniref:hypothetical protein n=1 Tax=Streptomyces sp. NPDC051636 TaxID=3365663 RepID=UPI003798DDE1